MYLVGLFFFIRGFMFVVDSHFVKGSSHLVCQDYSSSGFTFNGIPYIIISDGCSTAKDSDVGARLLVRATEQAINTLSILDSLDEPQVVKIIEGIVGGLNKLAKFGKFEMHYYEYLNPKESNELNLDFQMWYDDNRGGMCNGYRKSLVITKDSPQPVIETREQFLKETITDLLKWIIFGETVPKTPDGRGNYIIATVNYRDLLTTGYIQE